MKTVNGVLISCSEIKIGAGGYELFVVDLEGKEGQEMDTPLTLPPAIEQQEREREGFLISRKLGF